MVLVLEPDIGLDHAAAALDVDVVEAVDHDVADGRVLEQRLERAQAEDFVEDLLDDALALGERHGDALVADEPLDYRADLGADDLLVERAELIGVERVEQLGMYLGLDLKPAVGSGAGTGDGASAHEFTLYRRRRGNRSMTVAARIGFVIE